MKILSLVVASSLLVMGQGINIRHQHQLHQNNTHNKTGSVQHTAHKPSTPSCTYTPFRRTVIFTVRDEDKGSPIEFERVHSPSKNELVKNEWVRDYLSRSTDGRKVAVTLDCDCCKTYPNNKLCNAKCHKGTTFHAKVGNSKISLSNDGGNSKDPKHGDILFSAEMHPGHMEKDIPYDVLYPVQKQGRRRRLLAEYRSPPC
jgi:hypothetical protein